ncbi:MAG TPA: malto-oligosyltrehalose trehalohydrolase [Nitrospiraceae bacterium]|nr:malto-oligosyltrehalose trehalohydrolase [Nitrospiraceae bacterium]
MPRSNAQSAQQQRPEDGQRTAWRLPLGACVSPDGTHFRLWAPKPDQVEVVLESTGTSRRLEKDGAGYWSGLITEAKAGMAYRYRLGGTHFLPDPCSRFQPEGPHGPSLIVDPADYRWRDEAWRGIRMQGQVIYELHIGTFTPDGTFDSAIKELDELKRLGITVIEVMPVAEFPGRWNWGYDGVGLYAPAHVYGDHEALKRFVDEAHARGLAVILDVVYNHLGPDGNYLPSYSDDYFTDRYGNEWGQAINFDGAGSGPVREFFIQNAAYWINEFHLDGLRLDAVHAIQDASPVHVLAELSQEARDAAGGRSIILIAECESQLIDTIEPVERGGWGLDAVWSDDFHHVCRVAATGRSEAYYTDYKGTAQELVSAVKRAFLYQGQRYQWQKKARGTVVKDQPGCAFVFYIQNHDQVANQLWSDRLDAKTNPAVLRVLTALLLLAPETPMLFMGQEFAASSPFLFFTDHASDLAKLVHQGRRQFLAEFPSYGSDSAQALIPDPNDPATFQRSKLILTERERHAPWYALHKDLLHIRRDDPVIAAQARDRVDGAVIGNQTCILRYFGSHDDDRLLVINFGADLRYLPAPEPLIAPSPRGPWTLIWSSDNPRYGGPGIINPLTDEGWNIPGMSATFYAAGNRTKQPE